MLSTSLLSTLALAATASLLISPTFAQTTTAAPSNGGGSGTLDPAVTGNCLSGTFPFDPERMYTIPIGRIPAGEHYPPGLPEVDWSGYDYTIDYAPDNAIANNNSLTLKVTKIPGGGQGSRVSTTRHVLYGKLSMRMKAIGVKGMVTSFITMSDRGDEIDWEIINTNPETPATTNIFYKRILQFGVRNKEFPLPSGKPDDFHDYVIDWTSERIQWFIDGELIRTYTRADSLSNTDGEGKGEHFYPSTPSMIQIGAWDAGDSPSPGVSAWGGGPVPWGDKTSFEAEFGPLTVQCYDDKDKPVPMWPVDGNRKATKPTPPPKPTTSDVPLSQVDVVPLQTFLTSGPKEPNASPGPSPTASARVALGLNNKPSGAPGLSPSAAAALPWIVAAVVGVLAPLALI
ncbi:hypothetical protein HDU67_002478 [Dinochytrium kinnereticum]|nr:hypothetical protein HDU67_002478 [Dinochytrium kinnereticum]